MFDPIGILLQWGPHYGPHHGPMGGAGGVGGGFLWGPLWILLAIVVLIGGAFLAFHLLQEQEPTETADEALKLLRRRYATGEIDEEEFENRRTRLEHI